MTNAFLESLASLSEEEVRQALANLSPVEKAELDRLLASPGSVDAHTPPDWFHEAQLELWRVEGCKVVAFVAGAQSGKTVCAPLITLREIARKFRQGISNDHLVASPTFRLMSKKLLPEYRRVIEQELGLGEFSAGLYCITLSEDGIFRLTGQRPTTGTSVTIWFGHAQVAESLESATYMSAVLDEAGQDSFRPGSYEAILRRLTINRGTCYILTTPYNRNWFYEKVYRRAKIIEFEELENGRFERKEDQLANADSGIVVISCPSIMNPSFPREEWDFAKKEHPDWYFQMMFMGKFTLPAGVIFDSFTDENICPRFPIPKDWPVFLGVDFGLVNTAGVLVAEEWKGGEPTGRYFIFGTYLSGKAAESRVHVKEVHKMTPWKKPIAYGGAHAESGWREAWAHAGLPVFEPPFSGLWLQINTLWVAFEQNKLIVFDDLQNLINDLRAMTREIDPETDTVIPDRIKDEKNYHRIAALRYLGARLFRNIYRKLSRGDGRGKDDLPFPGAEPESSGGD